MFLFCRVFLGLYFSVMLNKLAHIKLLLGEVYLVCRGISHLHFLGSRRFVKKSLLMLFSHFLHTGLPHLLNGVLVWGDFSPLYSMYINARAQPRPPPQGFSISYEIPFAVEWWPFKMLDSSAKPLRFARAFICWALDWRLALEPSWGKWGPVKVFHSAREREREVMFK